MVSWPTKRFLLFYVTWCHFVYFTFWVTYQPISLPPHDNKNLFPPHWFQHQDTHFSSLFTPSQHWWNLRVSDEIFVFSFCSELWSILYLKYIYNFIIYLAFFHVLHIFFKFYLKFTLTATLAFLTGKTWMDREDFVIIKSGYKTGHATYYTMISTSGHSS